MLDEVDEFARWCESADVEFTDRISGGAAGILGIVCSLGSGIGGVRGFGHPDAQVADGDWRGRELHGGGAGLTVRDGAAGEGFPGAGAWMFHWRRAFGTGLFRGP